MVRLFGKKSSDNFLIDPDLERRGGRSLMIVVSASFSIDLLGIGGRLKGRSAWEVGKPLMDRVWQEIKVKAIENTGRNVWLYGSFGELFIGVEVSNDQRSSETTLEKKTIVLAKYAMLKHRGPYSGLAETYASLDRDIAVNGKVKTGVQLEIYGHDNGPNSVPEVDLLFEIE